MFKVHIIAKFLQEVIMVKIYRDYFNIFDVITSIKSMESMECMYEKVSCNLTAYPVTLLPFALPNVTFCGILRNIM